jgi:anion-transporting  ArsA/GET3 family ATPase
VTHSKVIDDLLNQKKLLMITGKGGIGKTLITCALAKQALRLGRRVLVVEQSSVEQVGALLGVSGVSHEETWHGDLGVANFTPSGNFKDFITKHLMRSGLLEVLVSNKIVHSFFTAIPGFAELMLLGRIYYALNLAPGRRPDLVLFDGYASGHFLSLMTTPDAVLRSGLAGPIIKQTQTVKNWLNDASQCATLYIAVPEDLVISETVEFLPALAEKSSVKLAGLIMNRCLPKHLADSESSGSGASDTVASGSVALDFLKGRYERQRHAIATYSKLASGSEVLHHLPVALLPELGAIEEPMKDSLVEALLGGYDGDK